MAKKKSKVARRRQITVGKITNYARLLIWKKESGNPYIYIGPPISRAASKHPSRRIHGKKSNPGARQYFSEHTNGERAVVVMPTWGHNKKPC